MAKERRPDLDLEIDDAFQRREWWVQRIGWLVLAVIIVGALLGLTGAGPLAKRRLTSAGMSLQWERFARAEARTEIRLEASAALVRDGALTVRIARPSFDQFKVEEVRPAPDRVGVGDAWVEYRFVVPDGARSTAVLFALRPQKIGEHELTITAADTPDVTVRQFAFP